MKKRKILIAGARGTVGHCALEHFEKLSSSDGNSPQRASCTSDDEQSPRVSLRPQFAHGASIPAPPPMQIAFLLLQPDAATPSQAVSRAVLTGIVNLFDLVRQLAVIRDRLGFVPDTDAVASMAAATAARRS